METNWQQWRLAGVGSLALLLVKSQSQVATRRCADVFNQQCKTASFQAPLWQAAVTLIAQLGCLSWWLTERVVHPVQSSAPMDGVTDAFGELHTHPPVWSYMFFAIPGALEVVALTMLYIALGTLPLSSVLAVFAFGYVAYRIFTACLGQRRLQRSDYVSFALLLLAAVFIAWAQIERVLQLTAAFTPSAFTPGAFNPGARAAPNTQLLNGKQTRGETVAGNTSPSLGSDLGLGPDLGGAIGGGAGQKVLADAVQIIDGLGQPTLSNESFLLIDTILFALLLGLAAGAVYTLRLIIVEGLLQRFRFHYMQALGLEALYGLSLAVVGLTVADGVMFEDSGVTMFQLITNVSLVYSTLGFIVLHFLYLLTSYYLVSNTRIFKGVCCSLGLWTGLSSGLRETKPGPRTGPSTRLSARRKHKATSEDEVEPDLTALYPVEFIYRLPLVLLGELVLQGGTGWCQMQGLPKSNPQKRLSEFKAQLTSIAPPTWRPIRKYYALKEART
ncbi:putative transmembrane protein [Gregarina niphandrodes]|uniref:Transmembrane protein n=1 Tax=Gregarina niphandrodes TaxID=110365 RepID=A0A023B1W1_GRENI|nr:putative transmembrane protein [Gregarina niphandrodes]EZG46816.1 putative transmembrane protein [Gregarina niphandrodes]|eukprot:XP_011132240.1 putative transmembrane protein [Gregarina niphandrodes]